MKPWLSYEQDNVEHRHGNGNDNGNGMPSYSIKGLHVEIIATQFLVNHY
jgi:hypothetical protein